MKKNTIPILSSICLIYFLLLIFMSHGNIIPSNFFRAVFELVTIPLIVLILILLGISIKKLHSEKWAIKSRYFFSILILVATIVVLIGSTICNI